MDESSTATVAPDTSPPERPAGRPVSITPAGSPSSPWAIGRLIAGRPVRFASGVNPMKRPALANSSSGASPQPSISPISTGRAASVGVSTASHCS